MKCRACWADKAYLHSIPGWRGKLMRCFLVPLKCHHCYHKFSVPWLLTIGKTLTPPSLRIVAGIQQVPRPNQQRELRAALTASNAPPVEAQVPRRRVA